MRAVCTHDCVSICFPPWTRHTRLPRSSGDPEQLDKTAYQQFPFVGREGGCFVTGFAPPIVFDVLSLRQSHVIPKRGCDALPRGHASFLVDAAPPLLFPHSLTHQRDVVACGWHDRRILTFSPIGLSAPALRFLVSHHIYSPAADTCISTNNHVTEPGSYMVSFQGISAPRIAVGCVPYSPLWPAASGLEGRVMTYGNPSRNILTLTGDVPYILTLMF
ncbi:hypothetical protein GGS23DRAFT_529686 [Durotheca rogersii]|uniref:uncharacterized protein n=1 Tax=Durotheca rogersii TaxID=419775 RepID=UPI00221FC604|nr:uncharacterized protein GGS23DRAFT_529686 [Durotheca rogersii]KAI5863369.1 hypothetical protein GGS23DRAFT_529686 [Durotheca rogersii]